MIGAMVRIRDDDGFAVRPVRIGDDVWIAHGAIVEPGVTIGRGAVIAAGSVVTCNVPDGTMAVGNPARVIPIPLASASRRKAAG
jgi:maltose O-acetyltransferase